MTPEERRAMAAEKAERKQALTEHIKALRKMLIVSVGAVLVAFVVLFYLFCSPLVDLFCSRCASAGLRSFPPPFPKRS